MTDTIKDRIAQNHCGGAVFSCPEEHYSTSSEKGGWFFFFLLRNEESLNLGIGRNHASHGMKRPWIKVLKRIVLLKCEAFHSSCCTGTIKPHKVLQLSFPQLEGEDLATRGLCTDKKAIPRLLAPAGLEGAQCQ